jgi:hypothetical protein
MREILRTNDPVVLSYATALLGGMGLATAVADEYMSALEGSIGVWPRRILVDADVEMRARRILTDAGLGVWLVPENSL